MSLFVERSLLISRVATELTTELAQFSGGSFLSASANKPIIEHFVPRRLALPILLLEPESSSNWYFLFKCLDYNGSRNIMVFM